MPTPWSEEEVEATVAQYFAMLDRAIIGERINKASMHRALAPFLHDRNEHAIYYKHRNISAILVEAGYPFVNGYAPLANYQALLAEAVLRRLAESKELEQRVAADVETIPNSPDPATVDPVDVFVNPPKADRSRLRYRESRQEPRQLRVVSSGVDYLQREASNQALGKAGEEFVVRLEQARLERAGQHRLAAMVEHVALTQGDGVGFDVLSFDEDSRERFIEVKTTKYPKETPFFVSQPEVRFSSKNNERYQLYRVFNFRSSARVFRLSGSVELSCSLEPNSYRARVA